MDYSFLKYNLDNGIATITLNRPDVYNALNDEITYEAYVSEQNLLMDDSEEPIKHPLIEEIFSGRKGSSYFKPSN